MRRVVPAVGLLLMLVLAAPARAAWFPAEPVDTGASAFGGLELARDGTGGAVYLKPVDGVAHVFLSRLSGGVWQPPEQVDAGFAEAASDPTVAAADAGHLVVAWRSANRVLAAATDDAGKLSAPVVLGSGFQVGPPDVDMAIQFTAYVVFMQDGDIRAARLRKGIWEGVPQPLDVDPAQAAGDGVKRPRVAVAADGNAVVAWGEDAETRRRVYARRITDLRVSTLPQEVSLPALEGAPGGPADSAQIAIEDDISFAWVTFREDFGGVSRAVTRRLVGSQFEAPSVLDTAGGARGPEVAMTGRGDGAGVTSTDAGEIWVSELDDDAFKPAIRYGLGAGAQIAVSQRIDRAVVWSGPDGVVGVHVGRESPIEGQTPLGPGGGTAVLSADRAGDFAAGWLDGNRVLVAMWDAPPERASGRTNRAWRRTTKPLFRWGTGDDLWGPQTYRVELEGRSLGTTTGETLRAPSGLKDGPYRWNVVSVDRRGQETRSKTRYVRVDTTAPTATARVRGGVVRVTVTDAGAGVKSASVTFGDGARVTTTRTAAHRGGGRTVRLRTEDLLGNARTFRIRARG